MLATTSRIDRDTSKTVTDQAIRVSVAMTKVNTIRMHLLN